MGFRITKRIYIYIFVFFKIARLIFVEHVGRFPNGSQAFHLDLPPSNPNRNMQQITTSHRHLRSKLHGLSTDAAMQNSPVGDPLNLSVDLVMDAGITCNFERLQVLALVQLRWNCRLYILVDAVFAEFEARIWSYPQKSCKKTLVGTIMRHIVSETTLCDTVSCEMVATSMVSSL